MRLSVMLNNTMTMIKNMSDRDLRSAIKLGNVNMDALKPEFQADVQARIDAMKAELKARK